MASLAVDGEASDLFEGPGFLEQVGGAVDDLQPVLASQLCLRGAVEVDDDVVVTTDYEQRWSLDSDKSRAGEFGPMRHSGCAGSAASYRCHAQTRRVQSHLAARCGARRAAPDRPTR